MWEFLTAIVGVISTIILIWSLSTRSTLKQNDKLLTNVLARLEVVEKDNRTLQTDRDTLSTQIGELRYELQVAQKDYKEEKEAREGVEKENGDLKHKIIEFEESIRSLETKTKNQETTIGELTRGAVAERERHQQETTRLSQLLTEAHQQTAEEKARADGYKTKFDEEKRDLSQQIDTLRKRIEDFATKNNTPSVVEPKPEKQENGS